MNEDTIMNEEIETNPVESADDGSMAGIALLVAAGAAGTIAVQQLYKRGLKPLGSKIKSMWTNRKKDKKKSDAEVEIVRNMEENAK